MDQESEKLKNYLSQIPEQFHKNLDEQIDDEIVCDIAKSLSGWSEKYDLLELSYDGVKDIKMENSSAKSQR